MAVPFITKLLSSTLIIVSGSIFGYYLFLVAVLPFIDKEHSLRTYFPDPYYAVAAPLIIVALALSAVCIAAGILIIRATQINDATPLSNSVEYNDKDEEYNDKDESLPEKSPKKKD